MTKQVRRNDFRRNGIRRNDHFSSQGIMVTPSGRLPLVRYGPRDSSIRRQVERSGWAEIGRRNGIENQS